jgi:hypothetical protein
MYLLTGQKKTSRQCNYFFAALIFAHRALAAAAILARAVALILRLFFGSATATTVVEEPKIWFNFFCRDSIWSLMSAACRNCCAERLVISELISHSNWGFGLKSQYSVADGPGMKILILVKNDCSGIPKDSEIAIAASDSDKKIKLFFRPANIERK